MTNNDHPEELLAGYADGTLTDQERADVEAHLSACQRCRDESALAMRAVASLRDLPEEPVPFGVMNPVTAEIGRRMARPAKRPVSQRVLWAAGAAVAAAFVAVVAASSLPNVGGGNASKQATAGSESALSSPTTAGSGGGAGAGGTSRVTLERTSTNYDDLALRTLATDTARATSRNTIAGPDTETAPESSAIESASACLARGADVQAQDRLVRLIQARYRGEPAYIGVYLTEPGAGQPADGVLVWVVGSDRCEFLSITSKKL